MAGHTDNAIVIGAPLEQVWRITNEVPNWPALFSEYATAEIMEQRGATIRFRLTMHPDDENRVWSWVSERTPDDATHTVRAHRVETGPFKYMSLFWEYTAEGDGTRMRWVQDFEMKPGAPATDAQMTAHLDRNTLVQMELIKQKIETAHAVLTS